MDHSPNPTNDRPTRTGDTAADTTRLALKAATVALYSLKQAAEDPETTLLAAIATAEHLGRALSSWGR